MADEAGRDNDSYERTDLINLAHGAVTEKFDRALAELLANIDDVNTSAKAKRSITIKVAFTPDPSRRSVSYSATVESKLAPAEASEDVIFVVRDATGAPIAVNTNVNQPSLFKS